MRRGRKPNLTITDFERQVIELVSVGKTNEEIGMILGISSRAVARRIDRAWSVTNTHSRTQLACHALRQGWIK